MELVKRQLYGGAIEIEIPKRFIDNSTFRQVPDHQEVYIDEKSDQSIIIELLEKQSHISDNEAIQFHFNDASDDQSIPVEKRKILNQRTLESHEMPNFQPTVPKFILLAQQKATKFNEKAENTINVYMCLVRLDKSFTDILITFNESIYVSPESSSINATKTSTPTTLDPPEQLFLTLLKSFHIKDYSLFQNQ